MTGNYDVVLVDENGVGEAEFPDAIGDLADAFRYFANSEVLHWGLAWGQE